jgi:hypothetical protein
MKHSSKKSKKLCIECQQRLSRFRFRGMVKRDDDHQLCFYCFRGQKDRLRELIRAGII